MKLNKYKVYTTFITIISILIAISILLTSQMFQSSTQYNTISLIFAMLTVLITTFLLFYDSKNLKKKRQSVEYQRLLNEIDSLEKKLRNQKKETKKSQDKYANFKKQTENISNITFLNTTKDSKSYKGMIKNSIQNAKKEILIMNTHWDNNILGLLCDVDSNILCNIITKPKDSGSKFHKNSIDELKSRFRKNLKFNNTLHARLLIIDEEILIIGSADLDSNSLENNFEAGVFIKDPITVDKAKEFFNKIWNN